eukprot:766107-Hanusia_phi.AAC.5
MERKKGEGRRGEGRRGEKRRGEERRGEEKDERGNWGRDWREKWMRRAFIKLLSAFEVLVKKLIQKMEEPATLCVRMVRDELKQVTTSSSSSFHFSTMSSPPRLRKPLFILLVFLWNECTICPCTLSSPVLEDVTNSCNEIGRFEELKVRTKGKVDTKERREMKFQDQEPMDERVNAECMRLLWDKTKEAGEFVQVRRRCLDAGRGDDDETQNIIDMEVAYINTDNPEFDKFRSGVYKLMAAHQSHVEQVGDGGRRGDEEEMRRQN